MIVDIHFKKILSKSLFVSLVIQELMVENNDLRESLQSMQTELIDLLNHQNDDCDNNTEVSSTVGLNC